MNGILDFLLTVWTSFSALNAVEQISMALSLPVTLAAIWGATRNFYRRKTKRLSADVAAEAARTAEQMQKRVQLEEELELVKAELPENWMAAVAKERRDGNEERAIGRLRDRMRDAGPEIAKAADELAGFHLSASVDLSGGHLAEAQRYARLGVLHDSDSASLSRLLEEITEQLSVAEPREREDFSDWEDLHSAFPTGDDGLLAISSLNVATAQKIGSGYFFVAERLNSRALLIGKRVGQPINLDVLESRLLRARVHVKLGRYEDALEEIDTFLPALRVAFGDKHQSVQTTGFLRAVVLDNLGRHKEAFAETETFSRFEVEALGATHPAVQSTRRLRAQILKSLGRDEDALAEIEAFAPIQREALGGNHTDVLATRYLRAAVLDNLGRYEDALAEIDAFAPTLHEEVGANHPNVLATGFLRAVVLENLGRYEDALAEIEVNRPTQRETLGDNHPNVKFTQTLRARILKAHARQPNSPEVSGQLPSANLTD